MRNCKFSIKVKLFDHDLSAYVCFELQERISGATPPPSSSLSSSKDTHTDSICVEWRINWLFKWQLNRFSMWHFQQGFHIAHFPCALSIKPQSIPSITSGLGMSIWKPTMSHKQWLSHHDTFI